MIPRVAQSGASFSGAASYYLNDKRIKKEANDSFAALGDYALHDKGDRSTAKRVGFTEILHMSAETPAEAIDQMSASYMQYKRGEAHKRGRKLMKPVYAYSLSWVPGESPTKEDMLEAAHSSLKALRLDGLRTLIVQHLDEPQPHIHLIVNRIELDGKKARNVFCDQLHLSRWAEQYERDHGGIVCPQRVENNERRAPIVHGNENTSLARGGHEAQDKVRSDVSAGMQKARDAANLATQHAHQGVVARFFEREEIARLETRTHARIGAERPIAKMKFRPKWSEFYDSLHSRKRELAMANRSGIFERAAFIYRHFAYLKRAGSMKPLQIAGMALSGKALRLRIDRAHRLEIAELGRWEKKLEEGAIKVAWREHFQELQVITSRHAQQRDLVSYVNRTQIDDVAARGRTPERPERMDIGRTAQQETPAVQRSEPAPTMQLGQGIMIGTLDAARFLQDTPPLRNVFDDAAHQLSGAAHAQAVERRVAGFKRANPSRDFDREL